MFAALSSLWSVAAWLRSHVGRASRCFFHQLHLQPVVILSFRANRLPAVAKLLLLNYSDHGCLTPNLGFDRTLSVYIRDCRVGSWLVQKHQLVCVRGQLATSSLVQMTSCIALRSVSTHDWISGKVHVVTNLNLILGYHRWHIRKLL